jgi:hypothetical protein
MKIISRFIFVAFVLILFSFPCAGELPEPLTRFLAKYMRFSRNELAAVDRGEIVAKALETNVKKELAFFGITRVKAPGTLLIERFRDIEKFKKGEAVLKVKKLKNPPVREDFNAMKLEPDDIKALKKCKPGNCDLKLSAEMIRKLQAPSNRNKSVDTIYQDVLYEYVQSYLAKGNAGLCGYNDEKKVVRVLDELNGILIDSPYLKDTIPALYEYLNSEKQPPNGVETFIYWSKETLGFRPVITMTQVSIYKPSVNEAVIASKQIYANHYMTGSLALTFLLAENGDLEKPGFYMMYINRSRTDMLGGLLAGFKRSIAKSRSTAALKENLGLIKKRLEER